VTVRSRDGFWQHVPNPAIQWQKGLISPGGDVGTGPGAMIALFAAFGIAADIVC